MVLLTQESQLCNVREEQQGEGMVIALWDPASVIRSLGSQIRLLLKLSTFPTRRGCWQQHRRDNSSNETQTDPSSSAKLTLKHILYHSFLGDTLKMDFNMVSSIPYADKNIEENRSLP